jgi:type IV pilus assembly protein PilO
MKLDFLKKAKKSELLAFTVMVCVIILIGYYFLFLAPVVSKLPSLFRESSELQTKISKAELSMNSIPRMKREIEELKSRETLYGTKLPKEEEFPAVLENLSSMARNSGVRITKIMPKKDTQAGSQAAPESEIYRQQAILIDAQCGYHQLGTFIAELESAERFMEISDIKIESGKANPKKHNVQLIVKTFILKGDVQ